MKIVRLLLTIKWIFHWIDYQCPFVALIHISAIYSDICTIYDPQLPSLLSSRRLPPESDRVLLACFFLLVVNIDFLKEEELFCFQPKILCRFLSFWKLESQEIIFIDIFKSFGWYYLENVARLKLNCITEKIYQPLNVPGCIIILVFGPLGMIRWIKNPYKLHRSYWIIHALMSCVLADIFPCLFNSICHNCQEFYIFFHEFSKNV